MNHEISKTPIASFNSATSWQQPGYTKKAPVQALGESSVPLLCVPPEMTAEVEKNEYEQTDLYKAETELYEAMYETWAMEMDFVDCVPLLLDVLEELEELEDHYYRDELFAKIQSVIDKWGLPLVIEVVKMWDEPRQQCEKRNAELEFLYDVSEKEVDAYYDRYFQGTDVFDVDYGSPVGIYHLDHEDIAELKAIDAATATPEELLDAAQLFDWDMNYETPGLLGWVDRQARKRLVEIQQAIAAAERINATHAEKLTKKKAFLETLLD